MRAEPVTPSDFADITVLLDCAFSPSTFESSLMLGLRKAERELYEWVVRRDEHVVAHVAFTKAYRGESAIGFHLAPVAVHPSFQRRGFGTALISQAMKDLRLATAPIFVLGNPVYYARFGFRHITNPVCPFDPKNEHFQAVCWIAHEEFTVGYEPEFHNALAGAPSQPHTAVTPRA